MSTLLDDALRQGWSAKSVKSLCEEFTADEVGRVTSCVARVLQHMSHDQLCSVLCRAQQDLERQGAEAAQATLQREGVTGLLIVSEAPHPAVKYRWVLQCAVRALALKGEPVPEPAAA